MLNINLNNLDTTEKDSVGSSYKPLETDVYDAEIKLAYVIDSKSSKAQGIELLLLINGEEKSFSNFFSTSDGKVTQINKQTNKEEVYFKYVFVNSLFNIVLNKGMNNLTNNDYSKKFIKKRNYLTKTEDNIEVTTIPAFEGKKIKVAITNTLINKYSDPSKTTNKNEIVKFFNEKGYTLTEVETLKNNPTLQPNFINEWLKVNKGKTTDKVDKSKITNSTSIGSKSVTELNLDDEEL